MIPTLYDKTGAVKIGVLNDCIECFVEEERNGIFELTMIYPADSSILESIVYDNIVVADANDYLKSQKFRIYNTRKSMANRIELCARHISFDLVHDWVDVISLENQSCEYALNTIFRNSQFSKHFKGHSDIVNAQNFKVNKVTCLEAIGGTDGSIIDTYGTGAEILRDNTDIHVLNRRGHDNDVTIEYRKNLTGLEVEEDTTDLVTRIMPYAIYTNSNNEEIEVRGDFIDSPLINNYAHPYVKYMDYSEKFEDDEVPTKTKLNNLAAKEYINNKVDIPKNNYKIEFIPLSKCAGYEGLEDRINLCDVVTIKDSRYSIDTQAKVIKVVFDVLRGRYDSMELGEPRTTLGDIIGGTGDGPIQGPPGPPGPQG
ncbi:MAG: phage tail protein, partial [Turicibacter sp.]|nr:phage tail protein [Turicibacter sp.]